MKIRIPGYFFGALLSVAALALAPAYADSSDGKDSKDKDRKELERARHELEQARDELRRAAQEMARVAAEQGMESPRAHAYEYMADQNRGMLGVIMDRGPVEKGQIKGVRVEAVTPESGADKAGLKSGDVIVSINGQSIATPEKGDTTPGRKLRDSLKNLKVGDQVKVGYERDGKKNEVTVTASRPSEHYGPFNVPVPPIPPIPPMPAVMAFDDDDEHDILIPGARMRIEMRGPGDWELVPLDENLGAYFKTRDGVLVARAEPDDKLGVKSGDVIQKVNGEAVQKPRDVYKRIGKLDPGAELKLDIVRAGRNETLTGKKPEPKHRDMHKHIEIQGDEEP